MIELGKSFKSDELDDLLDMIWVNEGSFIMGESKPEDGFDSTGFPVEISDGFWLSKFPVTQFVWNKFMSDNPSKFIGERLPVNNVSWEEATLFCKYLTEKLQNSIPEGFEFTLPTEAQWEYSCRAGCSLDNYGGGTPEENLNIAWCKENSEGKAKEVGLKKPNAWGFHDMIGNVLEWCRDSFSKYPNEPRVDWFEDDGSKARVLRGGCFRSGKASKTLYSAYRTYTGWDSKMYWVGFRVVLSKIRVQSKLSHSVYPADDEEDAKEYMKEKFWDKIFPNTPTP